MEQNSFIASAWSNGRTNNETGAGYGLRIKIRDRVRIFNENERRKPVTLKLVRNRKSCEVTVSIDNDCFWNSCPEFRDREIGLWFIENEFINRKPGSRPWPYRKPPKFQIVPIGKRMEYWVAGLMIKEGLDVYMPLVDDEGIDIVVR